MIRVSTPCTRSVRICPSSGTLVVCPRQTFGRGSHKANYKRLRTTPVKQLITKSSSIIAPSSTSLGASSLDTSVHAAAESWAQNDLLAARCKSGRVELLQVLSDWKDGHVLVGWKGRILHLSQGSGLWQLKEQGQQLQVDDPLHKAFPSMLDKVPHMATGEPLPDDISTVKAVYSLGALEAAVAQDAALWRDGTQPGAPEKTEVQAQTLTAGELLALEQGQRGVVIVQLWNGWDPSRGQPLTQPYVLQLLLRLISTPGIKYLTSTAPGGVGLTAVLYADKEPWSKWAQHLASFGCQANTVAGSPYYKLLIGRMLGYSEDNVVNYVRSTGGGLTPQVMSQVESDMKRVSKVKAKLPWNKAPSRGKPATKK
mmetsp:Transcript_14022/g.30350  ORF Transcript_14022/g.30350 Transcript_14022/m.30350 type:complete len:369 (-) Transcript_14022:363-1469(-)